ncbi:MAG: prepilin-type N-terminal cleavage/methylation domain-containing protein, partial [Candidatus Absconditabacteria bacterium]
MARKLKKFLKSFTLIELIIVIAIIAVLGVSAFLVLTHWLDKSKDAKQISDINILQKGLVIHY